MNQRQFYALLGIDSKAEGREEQANRILDSATIRTMSKGPDQTHYTALKRSNRRRVLDKLAEKGLFEVSEGPRHEGFHSLVYSPTKKFEDFYRTSQRTLGRK